MGRMPVLPTGWLFLFCDMEVIGLAHTNGTQLARSGEVPVEANVVFVRLFGETSVLPSCSRPTPVNIQWLPTVVFRKIYAK